MIIGLTALAIIMGFLGRYVAKEKNRSAAEGFWIGFLFSILGVIIVALLPTKEKEKPTELTDERRKEIESPELSEEELKELKELKESEQIEKESFMKVVVVSIIVVVIVSFILLLSGA